MEHFTTFQGKCVSIDLARVLAFERHHAHGIAEILGQRRRMRVTLSDGSDVYVEDDEDTESFIRRNRHLPCHADTLAVLKMPHAKPA